MKRLRTRRVLGALALSGVLAAAASAEVHIVNQSGDTFSPENITIRQGDSVRWIWSSGFHTVTHGTPDCVTDPNPLFDAPLEEGFPEFEYQFNDLGFVPYFCIPHCHFAMVGTVTVAPSCDGREAITKAKCKNKNGVRKMNIKVTGVPGDSFSVRLSSGERKSGTLNDRGAGKAKFKDLPAGPGTATATFGCGAEVTANYDCPA